MRAQLEKAANVPAAGEGYILKTLQLLAHLARLLTKQFEYLCYHDSDTTVPMFPQNRLENCTKASSSTAKRSSLQSVA